MSTLPSTAGSLYQGTLFMRRLCISNQLFVFVVFSLLWPMCVRRCIDNYFFANFFIFSIVFDVHGQCALS